MSEPHEPGQPGGVPPTEQEPAPSAAPPAAEHAQVPPAATPDTPPAADPRDAQTTTGMPMPPPPGEQAGHYVFVPAGASGPRARRFGPAMGRFARNHATHLVAAVVVGAVVGGATVAVVDNVAGDHQQRAPFSRGVGPFQGGQGHRPPGFGFGGGGQGPGN